MMGSNELMGWTRSLWSRRSVAIAAILVTTVAAIHGCGSSSDSGPSGAAGTTGGSAGAAQGGQGGDAGQAGTAPDASPAGSGGQAGSGGVAGQGGSAGDGGQAGEAGSAGSAGGGMTSLKSLVILGDSISDGGGQAPFYYDLLKADLATKYGGSLSYHKTAQSGSKTSALLSQIDALPNTLPSPVAVCITSGGNDMKAVFAQIITGTDQAARATMGSNIQKALDELLKPGKFGAGVEVRVFEGNIYDASDGAGDFSKEGCPWAPKGIPAMASDPFFTNWNEVIATQVTQHGQTLADMHAHFYGHGYNHPPSWYANDCTHPNATGHDQLRRLYYQKITGEALP